MASSVASPSCALTLHPRVATAAAAAAAPYCCRVLLAVVLVALLNLMHFSQGWVQFGYRFSNDFVPFALILVALGFERVARRHRWGMPLGMALVVAAVHAIAMIGAGGGLAWLVYRYLGLKFVSRSWFNLDAVWASSLIVTGALSLGLAAAR